jgi:hypothetical protein
VDKEEVAKLLNALAENLKYSKKETL